MQKEKVGGAITPTEPFDLEPDEEQKKQSYDDYSAPALPSKLSSKTQEDHAKCHGRAFSSDEDGDGPMGDHMRSQPYTAEHAMQST